MKCSCCLVNDADLIGELRDFHGSTAAGERLAERIDIDTFTLSLGICLSCMEKADYIKDAIVEAANKINEL